ncbi:hypothetical protein GJ744_000025 [Endocarpon pusillum]|uniref:Uncharacterized protein n=1 Tax=Endocarpon pusillum TaxID=364733 RepID=A0A8H7EA70_9EURO|nr:hypothetical protein GJ744_000025 [Endocarpon pusillum]
MHKLTWTYMVASVHTDEHEKLAGGPISEGIASESAFSTVHERYPPVSQLQSLKKLIDR